ncbi:MAG: hypothetical protein CL946_03115 [Ectothiorhodospiraceae bacterium]|nr:hypothetical protein [Ectothiorhodospiraceae bacterium]
MAQRTYISFTIGTRNGVFALDDIVEIYRIVGFKEVDEAPRRVIGYCSFRGQPMYGIDIHDVFGLKQKPFDANASIIITLAQQHLFGVLVDKIGEIHRLDETAEKSRQAIPADIQHDHVRRVFEIDGQTHFEIEILGLLNNEERLSLLNHSRLVESTENEPST